MGPLVGVYGRSVSRFALLDVGLDAGLHTSADVPAGARCFDMGDDGRGMRVAKATMQAGQFRGIDVLGGRQSCARCASALRNPDRAPIRGFAPNHASLARDGRGGAPDVNPARTIGAAAVHPRRSAWVRKEPW